MPNGHLKSLRANDSWWRQRAARRHPREALGPLFGALLIAASFIYDRLFQMDGPTLCPLARATGVPCPTCGMTRAFVALADGDLAAAFQAHPIAVWLYAWLLAAVIAWGVRLIRNRPPHQRFWRISGGLVALAMMARWVLVLAR